MKTVKKIFVAILLTILASSTYADYQPGVGLSGYPNSCNQLVWVNPVQYSDGTWVPGHYVTVNNCSYNAYPGYFYYGYRNGGEHHWDNQHNGNWNHGGGGLNNGGGFHGGGHRR